MAKPVPTALLEAAKHDVRAASRATSPHRFISAQRTRWGERLALASGRLGTKPAFWLGIYSKFVFALFVAYHAAILILVLRLIEVVPQLWAKTRQPNWDGLLWGVCLIVVLAIILRLSIELWRGIDGLVTGKLDQVTTEPINAIVCTPEMAPQLHKLIADVGRRVGAPLPNVLQISSRAECFVCETRRFSISTQRELTLVLGLPHLAVLNTSELEVIVAHELAHFRFGDTRLGVFLHRFLESLRDANERQGRTRMIDPVHWMRWALFRLAYFLVAPVWKYQELRADMASASAYGGRLTARTLLREWLLGQQFEATVDDYAALSSHEQLQKTLAEFNVYREFAARFQSFSPQAEEYVRQRLALEEEESLFDSHPTMHARVDAVLAYPDLEDPNLRPASHLLSDFSALEDQLQRDLFDEPQPVATEPTLTEPGNLRPASSPVGVLALDVVPPSGTAS